MTKFLREVQRKAGVEFASLARTGGGHYRGSLPNGAVLFLPATPSDWRAMRNAVAEMKKATA